MKNIKIITVTSLMLLLVIVSCKSDTKEETIIEDKELQSDSTSSTFVGEFIHVDTAAVLKGRNFIYGVKMNEVAENIISQVNDLKNDEYDVINVNVTGELTKNDGEGWPEIISIKTLEKVYKAEVKEETKVLKYSSNKSE